MDLLLETGDQLAVGVNQRLFGFDLRDDGLLRGEGWEGNLILLEKAVVKTLDGNSWLDALGKN